MINVNQAEIFFYQNAIEGKTYKILEKENNMGSGVLYKNMKRYRGHFGLKDGEIYCKKTYLRYKYGEEIKQKYLEGQSTCSLAKQYNFNDHGIADLLESLGVKIRTVGIPSKTDQNLFSVIDNAEKAYFIGLLTADGSVNESGRITLCLTESDRYLLDEINTQLLQGSGRVYLTHKEDPRPRVTLSFNGKKLCKDLEKHGIVPRKTYSLQFLSKNIPLVFYPDYIRGLYDGDGVCSKSNGSIRIGYCAHNKSFTEEYQNYLCDVLKMRRNKLFNTGSCWQCSWAARADLQKFYNYIYYKQNLICLLRKKTKLENYLF